MKKLILFLFLAVSFSMFAQNNTITKGVYSVNSSDTAFLQTVRTNLQNTYGNTGGLFYNPVSQHWRYWDGALGAWQTIKSTAGGGGTPGGLNTQIQYNNAGVFGGASAGTYDNTLNRFTFTPVTNANGAFNLFNTNTVDPTTTIAGDMWYIAGGNPAIKYKAGSTVLYNMGITTVGAASQIPYESGNNPVAFSSSANLTWNNANVELTGGRGKFSNQNSAGAVNLNPAATDPTTSINGDLWINSTTNYLGLKMNGASFIGMVTPITSNLNSIPYQSSTNPPQYNLSNNLTWNNATVELTGGRGLHTNQNNAGAINLAPAAGDPTTPIDGDIWYNSTITGLKARMASQNRIIANFNGNPAITGAIPFTQTTTQGAVTTNANLFYTTGTNSLSTGRVLSSNQNNAGALNLLPAAGDPSTTISGDLWYNSTLQQVRANLNGTTVSLGLPAGTNTTIQYNNSGVFGASTNFTWLNSQNALSLSTSATIPGNMKITAMGATSGSTQNFYLTSNPPTAPSALNANLMIGDVATNALTGAGLGGNTVIGMNTGVNITSGSLNTIIGSQNASGLSTGTHNIFIGDNIASGAATSNNLIIGANGVTFIGCDQNNFWTQANITSSLNFASTAAQNSSDLTITVTGAASGDIVNLGVPAVSTNANSCFTAFVSSANTVTVRFNNYSSAAIDPAVGTFKVIVIH